MELDFVIIANNAFVDKNGRLSVIQTFDSITSDGFPAIHPQMSIVTKWSFKNNNEKNKTHTQEIIIKNESGKPIGPSLKKSLRVENGGDHLQFIANIVGLKFDDPGKYTLDVIMDDKKFETNTAIKIDK